MVRKVIPVGVVDVKSFVKLETINASNKVIEHFFKTIFNF